MVLFRAHFEIQKAKQERENGASASVSTTVVNNEGL